MLSECAVLYVVHCVDTEGPLYEDISAHFQQLKRVFGIDVEPTRENLVRLQQGLLDLNGAEAAVQELLDPHKITMSGSWSEIDRKLAEVTAPAFRMQFPDSFGQGWKFSWFCMDHVGFSGNNPRRRAYGHHQIFDHYQALCEKQKMGDVVQFHHHPVSFSGNFNDSGTAYWGRGVLNEIIARKIIDRGWFPSAYRAGFHTERPDSHWFLEQWIPFDYTSQAMSGRTQKREQPDLSGGRFGDWRHAPAEWHPYHPHHDDYQRKGNCHRWITRCLNMHARLREITTEDVQDAFEDVAGGRNAILAFTDHDYKDMKFEIEKVQGMLTAAAKKYPQVRFRYADCLTAMRGCLGLENSGIGLHAEIVKTGIHPVLRVSVKGEIFGPQPFLALKFRNGQYNWDNFDFPETNCWSYTFDANTIPLELVESVGVAANNAFGAFEVVKIDVGE